MTFATWTALLTTFAVAVMSPGPDFLATLRMSLARGRKYGLGTGLGIGVGTSVWAIGTMAGVVAVISSSPTTFLVVRVFGATFLALYGARILLSAYRSNLQADSQNHNDKKPLSSSVADPSYPSRSPEKGEHYPWRKAFQLGFITTTVGNPKAVIFFTTLFAALLPSSITLAQGALLTLLMVLISSTWFALVATIASSPAFIRGYEKLHTPIDVALGIMFIVLGLLLIPWASLAR